MPQSSPEDTTIEQPTGADSPLQSSKPKKEFQKKKVIFRAYQIIWYALGVIETLLIFRFALKMIGANLGSPFTIFIYGISDVFAGPFRFVVFSTIIGSSVFEWSTLVAAVVYAVIAYGLVYFFQLVKPVPPGEIEEGVNNP